MTKKGFAIPGENPIPTNLMKPEPLVEEENVSEPAAAVEMKKTPAVSRKPPARLQGLIQGRATDTAPTPTGRINVDIAMHLVNKIDHLSIEQGRAKKEIVEEMIADAIEYIERQRGNPLPDWSIRLPRGPRG